MEQAIVAKAAGADLVINRHEEDVVARIQEVVNTPGSPAIDRIIDVAFGETLASAVKLLKPSSVIATYASDAQSEPTIPFWPLLFLDATVRFVNVFHTSQEDRQSAIQTTNKGLQEGWLKTTIASRFPLEQIAAAHEASESGKIIGKIVVLIGEFTDTAGMSNA
jgi:NADPH2:quinone reductase